MFRQLFFRSAPPPVVPERTIVIQRRGDGSITLTVPPGEAPTFDEIHQMLEDTRRALLRQERAQLLQQAQKESGS